MTAVIVIAGNPVDGFEHYGPFATADDATAWASRDEYGMEWWITTLIAPEDDA